MTSEAPKYIVIESVKVADVRDSDEIQLVRFSCASCGRSIQEVLPEAAEQTLLAFAQDKCRGCLQYTGFQFPENKAADTSDKVKELARLLAENQKHLRSEARVHVEALLKDRNLEITFKVKRPQ